ncbi:mitochondrial trans-2-enoyl-CoA reductase [Rhodotorula toruloides]|uniref:enoyl-[acyl-carrier-protein] reductase n=1 Tax=Rhodotorula toruloides TaxID=5286 RepID=A0A511KA99_RHOTO|nr:mitochondrial trans-2-enoyl-CoA reductase [Rhodotorula toruloides]
MAIPHESSALIATGFPSSTRGTSGCDLSSGQSNVIQGVYPAKPVVRDDIGPEPVSIMGNEGVATVEGFEEDGNVEQKLKVGDRVVMGVPQLGTWQSHANLPFTSLIPLPESCPLSLRQAATLAINPPTALRMLSDFVPLNPEDPNALTKQGGKKQPSIAELKSHLESLGADHVLTYDEFLSRENNTRSKIKEWIGKDGEMRLALNCVGGKETAEMCKLLSLDGKLVTYGGMAKTALALPPSLFIFRKLTSTGFWLSNWVQTHPEERQTMMQSLAALVSSGKLKEPETEVVELEGTDEEVTRQLSEVMKKMEEGRGKKTLLHWKDE